MTISHAIGYAMVTPEELVSIVERLRSQHTDDGLVEAKKCAKKLSADVWETVSAFANTGGGLIVLGLDESSGFLPVEGFEIDKVRDQFIAGIGDGGERALVSPTPHYRLSRGIIEGKPVLLVEIDELDISRKPCYIVARGIQNGSYKRVDDEDIRLSPTELYELQSVLLPSDADGAIVEEATVDDLDGELIDEVIAARLRQSPRVLKGVETREGRLARLNITNNTGAVRLAGLLAVGLYPQQYYPKLVIDVAVHPGDEKSQPDAPRFLDRQICDGSIADCIEDALNAIGRNLKKSSYVSGAGRFEEWEIPEEVLREALANAAIHREYSPMFMGQSVSVDIYSDRVEISNPGGLWGGKTLDNLANGESRCRNQKLMNLMGAVPLRHTKGHVAESQGSGVLSMIREMEQRSLGKPRFKATADSFTVVLSRHGAEIADNRAWLSARASRELDRREETLVMVMKEAGAPLSVRQVRERVGWDSDDIRAICDKLLEEGMLVKKGDDVFSLVEGGAPQVREASSQLAERIVRYLGETGEASAREIAEALDEKLSRVRYVLPKLIDDGEIAPTTGPHSRNRKYRGGATGSVSVE